MTSGPKAAAQFGRPGHMCVLCVPRSDGLTYAHHRQDLSEAASQLTAVTTTGVTISWSSSAGVGAEAGCGNLLLGVVCSAVVWRFFEAKPTETKQARLAMVQLDVSTPYCPDCPMVSRQPPAS